MHLSFALQKARREHPHRIALICGDRRKTYLEFADRVERLCGALQLLGVKPGDRVGMLGPDSDRYVEFYYAVWSLGAIATPINCRWSANEIAFSLRDCEPQILVVDDPFTGMIPIICEQAPTLKTIIFVGNGAVSEGALRYEDLIAVGEPPGATATDDRQAAALFYTGGTTGRSKGVLLSHQGLYDSTMGSLVASNRAEGAVCLHCLPLFHVGGVAVMLHALARQNTQVFLPTFDPPAFLDAIEGENVSEAALVPSMIKRLLDHAAMSNRNASSWARLYYGASPIDETLLEKFIERFPNVALTQYYGMTETSAIAVALPDWCHRKEGRARDCHFGAGFATPTAAIRVVGAQGEDLPSGQIGEILLGGAGVMMEYWNQPELTSQVLQNGWMHTGDAGYLDGEGLLYIVDRIKDMIVTGGENVFSTEVENAILSLPGVVQCAVIGVPDAEWGERVHAVLLLEPDAAIAAQDVIDHCKSRIAGYKCPKSVEFRKEMPISGAGKLMKYKLREPYWAGRSRHVA